MPRPKKAVSPFSLFCTLLRTNRALTQAELGSIAATCESTIKNAEGDRAIAFETLVQIYRTSLKITSEEWHQLVGYWLLKAAPGSIGPMELSAGITAAAASTQGGIRQREAGVLEAMSKLAPDDAATFTTLAELATGPRGSRILSAIRGILDLL